jgi:hypothetical protein
VRDLLRNNGFEHGTYAWSTSAAVGDPEHDERRSLSSLSVRARIGAM